MIGSLNWSISEAEHFEMRIWFHVIQDFTLDKQECGGIYTIGGDRVGQLFSDDYRDILRWLEEYIPLEIEKNRKAIANVQSTE